MCQCSSFQKSLVSHLPTLLYISSSLIFWLQHLRCERVRFAVLSSKPQLQLQVKLLA